MRQGKIAVVSAPGIGDGLIMHIFSHNLMQLGYEVTTFNDHLEGFGKWLPGYRFAKLGSVEGVLQEFDSVVLQHDNSPQSRRIDGSNVFRLFGSHNPSKHGILQRGDFVCDPNRSMVDNAVCAMEKWFGASSKENGLRPPEGLIHRKNRNRVAIHPISGAVEKNWPRSKFAKVADWLKENGYDPIFLTDKGGRPLLPTLEALASFVYESGAFLGNDSGPGHLASYLQIPSLIIGKEARQMRLWRPGWSPVEIATPPIWSSDWKWTRKRWSMFITTRTAIKQFKQLNVIKQNL